MTTCVLCALPRISALTLLVLPYNEPAHAPKVHGRTGPTTFVRQGSYLHRTMRGFHRARSHKREDWVENMWPCTVWRSSQGNISCPLPAPQRIPRKYNIAWGCFDFPAVFFLWLGILFKGAWGCSELRVVPDNTVPLKVGAGGEGGPREQRAFSWIFPGFYWLFWICRPWEQALVHSS